MCMCIVCADIQDSVPDWHQFLTDALTGARTAPAYLFNKVQAHLNAQQIKLVQLLITCTSLYTQYW